MSEGPLIGEIKKGKYVGKDFSPRQWFIWIKCDMCETARWVYLRNRKGPSMRCRGCTMKANRMNLKMEQHPMWQGGRRLNADGYIRMRKAEHPRSVGGYVLEHILVAEQKIGRPLKSNEIVHHLNHIRSDNRPENLVVMSRRGHTNLLEAYIRRIRGLERELELQKQINRGAA